MENRPVITFSGRTTPREIEEKHEMWMQGAYIPLYMKFPGIKGLDTYKILRRLHNLPSDLTIAHGDNFENLKKRQKDNADNLAMNRDQIITFPDIVNYWRNVYELIRSFRPVQASGKIVDDTVVDDAPFIHIEGYKIPPEENEKYETWFVKWASRAYVPLLIRLPGVKACNFFKLIDYQAPAWAMNKFIEKDMPRYMSITYFGSQEAADDFGLSLEYYAFIGSLEFGFQNSLRIVWDVDYKLASSHRR